MPSKFLSHYAQAAEPAETPSSQFRPGPATSPRP